MIDVILKYSFLYGSYSREKTQSPSQQNKQFSLYDEYEIQFQDREEILDRGQMTPFYHVVDGINQALLDWLERDSEFALDF